MGSSTMEKSCDVVDQDMVLGGKDFFVSWRVVGA